MDAIVEHHKIRKTAHQKQSNNKRLADRFHAYQIEKQKQRDSNKEEYGDRQAKNLKTCNVYTTIRVAPE